MVPPLFFPTRYFPFPLSLMRGREREVLVFSCPIWWNHRSGKTVSTDRCRSIDAWLSKKKNYFYPPCQAENMQGDPFLSALCFLLPLWAPQELKRARWFQPRKFQGLTLIPVHSSRIFKNKLLFPGQNVKSAFYLCPRTVGHALTLYPFPELSTVNVFFTIKTTIGKKPSAQTGSCLTYEIPGIKLTPVSSKTKKPELHAFLGDSHLLQELKLEFPWQDKQFQWEGKPKQVEVSI